MKKVIIIVLVAVVAIAGAAGVYAVANKSDKPAESTAEHDHSTHSHDDTEETEAAATNEEAAEAVTITYTDNGYSPATVIVKTGGKVTIKNDSNRAMQFDSDPHPSHTTNRELNADNVAPGGSETFTVTKTGTFGYHNHLNEDETGTIVVK